jgi:transcriptional regulator with XRE-family HTH domain
VPHDRETEIAEVVPSAEVIGARLREARTMQGLGVRELARRIGVTPSMVSQLERGKVMPSVTTLAAIARELELSLDELFAVRAGS